MSVRELVDVHGRLGFDVLCVSDHTVAGGAKYVHAGNHERYLAELALEAARARARYDLLVVPGLELTCDADEPEHAAHAVAVGLRHFVGVDDGLEIALASARAHGAALVAAHPYTLDDARESTRRTARWFVDRSLAGAVDRYELFNRHDLFGWVAEAGLPAVACGDVHRAEHVGTWKTLLPCAKDETAVVAFLRSGYPASLVDLSGASVAA
jgi:hypothetical protein